MPGYSPITFFAINSVNEILGVLCGILQSEGSGIKSYLSTRVIVFGGPLVINKELKIANNLLESLVRSYKSKSIYIEFRNLFEISFLKEVFLRHKFSYKRHLNLIVNLDDDTLLKKRMSESRLRQVKAGLKSGAVIKQAETIEELKEFYQILKEKYSQKIKKPLVDFKMFENFYRLPDAGKIFLIKYVGKVIGGIVCPVFGNKVIYEWYIGGMDDKFKKQYPSVLATYAPIEYGLKNKLVNFDFMGAGSPGRDYGVREFKSKFGGKQVEYGRYIRINYPLLFSAGEIGLKFLGMIKSL